MGTRKIAYSYTTIVPCGFTFSVLPANDSAMWVYSLVPTNIKWDQMGLLFDPHDPIELCF